MGYAQIIYRDEIDTFLKNFKEMVMNNRIPEIKNKKEMLMFLILFEKQLDESVTLSAAYDLRSAMLGTSFKS
jgi:hypothetical protein